MATGLAVEGLRKSFAGPPPLEVLGGIGFTVGEGEFVSLVGPSGCGKTTLLLALSGLQRSDGGTVRFAGNAVRGATPAGMAIVFPEPVMMTHEKDSYPGNDPIRPVWAINLAAAR